VETVLLKVLVQLIVIIAAARVFGALFVRIGQPQVCGEVAAGLVLGPSLFGRIAPGLFRLVFAPEVSPTFGILSQIGLILLMFLIGMEFDFSHLRANGRTALSISVAGIVMPFGLGLLIAPFIYARLGEGIHSLGFALFLATALSITAIPTLGRIMLDFNINRSFIGSLTITAAAIDDASGWIILTIVASVVRSSFHAFDTLLMIAEILAYAAFMIFVVRPLVKRWICRTVQKDGALSLTTLSVILVLILLSAVATSLIGIFAIFGGFMMGAILHDETAFRTAVTSRFRDFTTAFFLPIFFTYTGLRTDMGTMQSAEAWALAGLVLLAAVIGKVGGCTIAARLNGLSWQRSSTIGVMMNTRGLMELIVINLGYELGVIPKSVFFMLVLMAVVTTYMTSPILRRLIRGTELEPLFAVSPFMQASAGLPSAANE
jgi:Kef-type K+ transport system membrane component KefB